MNGHNVLGVAQKIIDICKSGNIDSSLTPMQVIKLTYIAHGWTLGLLGRPLIREHVEAWQYGPVIKELYQAVKKYGDRPVACIDDAPAVELDPQELDIVQQVCRLYGGLTGIELSRLTHKPGTPWAESYERGSRSVRISNDLIEQHYKALSQRRPQEAAA